MKVPFAFCRVALLAAAAGALICTAAFADGPVGSVESASGTFGAVRNGAFHALEAGGEVFDFDTVKTGDDGSAVIRFLDNTTLEMRESSEVLIKEVVSTEGRDRFNVGIVEGAARVVTGAIVRKNPRGFKVTTPGATIGIRGTDLTVGFTPATGITSVSVAHTESSVSVTDKSSGVSVTGVTGFSMSVNTAGIASINNVQCNLNEMESLEAAAAALSGQNVGISTAEGDTVGSSSSGGDGGSGSGGGGDGGNGSGNGSGGSGSSGGGSSGGGSSGGGDCGSDNSSPGN